MVSTHSRPKAAGKPRQWSAFQVLFQHTAARRRLVAIQAMGGVIYHLFQHTAARRRLGLRRERCSYQDGFNTQPPEGGWTATIPAANAAAVSTHSRPKAAG